ncbi:MAG TPA: hypothetical protein VKQ70_11545 [Caulobacteraceae bacterium]|nr:hypothetical protein [Caulobacteraceae bacterium]
MDIEAPWRPYDEGRTIGARGSERGVIVADEEHEAGTRITLEKRRAFPGSKQPPFAITCGVYGGMMHTRFFRDEAGALEGYAAMKPRLLALAVSNDRDWERNAGKFLTDFP